MLDPNRLKKLSENVSDFPEEFTPSELEQLNADDQSNSKISEIFKTVAQSQDLQQRNMLYWIRRVSMVSILFGFSVIVCILRNLLLNRFKSRKFLFN